MNSMKEKIKCRHFTTFLTENEDIKNCGMCGHVPMTD